ncbi:MAG: hypothetical protein ACPGVI_03470 [Crocinitomicaceae bacterium]
MKRVQLFEFEDFNWFPNWLRGALTNLLVVLHKMMGVNQVIADLVKTSIKDKNINQIVDLGSGSGGSMPEVAQILQNSEGTEQLSLLMTDLYPNKAAIARFNKDGNNSIRYHDKSVDATALNEAPEGLKTMMNCFHHMRPNQAKGILQSAEENKQPILIYEMGENKIPLVLWWVFLPISLVIMILMVFFMTPFVRPMNWKQLVFTYLIPIIPIFYAWDGQASMPRLYAMKDIDEMLEGMGSDSYSWKQDYAYTTTGKKMGTYILGMPK